jgi:hypothetical protein
MQNYAIIAEEYYAGLINLEPEIAREDPRYTSVMPEGLKVDVNHCPRWSKGAWIDDQSAKAKAASAKYHPLPDFLNKNA